MITLKNVSKWYGHFQVLTDCSTEVKKGEVVVVCCLLYTSDAADEL